MEVLVDIAQANGVAESDARSVLTERTHKHLVDADWEKARRFGVTGVPSFVAGNRKVTGAQPYEVLEQLVVAAGAEPRAAERFT